MTATTFTPTIEEVALLARLAVDGDALLKSDVNHVAGALRRGDLADAARVFEDHVIGETVRGDFTVAQEFLRRMRAAL